MDELFKIYVEQLKSGTTEEISATFPCDFIEQKDEELAFDSPVVVTGQAYLADQELILHFDIHTSIEMPCSICNEPVRRPIEITNFYHAEELEKIKTGIFCYNEIVRDALLLEAPHFIECCNGKCPARKEYDRFFHQPAAEESPALEEGGYQPFKDLNLLYIM